MCTRGNGVQVEMKWGMVKGLAMSKIRRPHKADSKHLKAAMSAEEEI